MVVVVPSIYSRCAEGRCIHRSPKRLNSTSRWGQEGWRGGHINGASLIYVSPLVSTAQANQSMSEVAAYVRSQGGTAVVKQHPSFLAFYEENVISNSVSVGSRRFSDSRIIPQSVFKSAGGLVGEGELRQAVGDQVQV